MKKAIPILMLMLLTLQGIGAPRQRKAATLLQPRVEPAFWWTGMKNPALQLMVHGKDIALTRVVVNHPGVLLKSVTAVENPNYLFVDLDLGKATPGKFDILFQKEGKNLAVYSYELKEREAGSAERQGFNSSDVMYLVMPDRFANGNPDNDEVAGMKEKPNRADLKGRQGGDIQGLRDHLDYISGMGFTAVWLNPLLENDMHEVSYHGYATTDFYKVDPRYGSNEEYRAFALEARRKGIKLIMDMIFNHCGSEHWWMKDMPMADWLNFYPDYKITTHIRYANQDIHASDYDRKLFSDGWFVPVMPDLNQRNPYLATYLIQNSIWWIEYVGLSGIRMDTYSYPDKELMAAWNRRIGEEYPSFNIVGEEWHMNQAILSYWQKGKTNLDGYQGELRSLMDFPLQNAVSSALRDEGTGALMNIYECLANDFQYPEPENLVVFPGNHDMPRFFVQVNKDVDLVKMGIGLFLTIRGIPQLYYGDEVLVSHDSTRDHDSQFRKCFPGGWAGDPVSGFTGKGLTSQEKEVQDFIRKIALWRKDKKVIHTGKLMHFVPFDGFYLFFRYNDKEKVMVVLNKNNGEAVLKTDRLSEMLTGCSGASEIITGKTYSALSELTLPGKSISVFELH
ncbi:MAG TPA: glycoside hydrolase family 13 protein [Prolixibacteraceae bacterium]|jgi:glycosidase|nr:glycoside hydrolase family 13 protein [Prolixibacteraceae bacterium]HOF54673.1 glycoside hydrolase family 13 protein [Prolixibacteraceae bacterium]HOR99643.1 glycoside hydrolase family 13 protein [Prolixibacteraceae bacterium]HOS89060.1 glycoside hydrolase family 13 protein [Prolixibacteraceae bacterium]HPL44312.1 glycoside hydrolase family 13 protein [Prolixibacteraceae bacterium]